MTADLVATFAWLALLAGGAFWFGYCTGYGKGWLDVLQQRKRQ